MENMESPFEKFCDMIRSLDVSGDSIVLDRNLKYLASDIIDVLEGDENMLSNALHYFNQRSIEDSDFGMNFALLFTSRYFDPLKDHLMSSDGNCTFRAEILNMLQQNYSNAENLKAKNIEHFYNSVYLLGEFYNRLHQKAHPILIMGKSLFELLTKQLRKEFARCTSDGDYAFDVRFARLLLAQVTLNGRTARPSHQAEIETLFIDIRKCLIEIPNLASATKAFLLMTLDLYYNDFTGMGANLGAFYGKILDAHDDSERTKKLATLATTTVKAKASDPATNEDTLNGENSFSLRNLRTDFANLQTSFKPSSGGSGGHGGKGAADHNTRINKEYLNRPLKASERLKYIQRNSGHDSEPKTSTHRSSNADEKIRKPHSPIQKGSSSQHINQNDTDRGDEPVSHASNTETEPTRTPLQSMPSNSQESTQPDSTTSTGSDAQPASELPKFGSTFNWFEAVENLTNDQFSNNNSFNNSGDKFDTMSLASYSSNPVSPNERDDGGATSPRSFRNRSRRNSLNRFRSEYYKQSNESLNQPQELDRVSNRSVGRNNNNRSGNNQSNQLNSNYNNHHQSWRNSGRNSPRNGYHNNRRGGGGGGNGGNGGGGGGPSGPSGPSGPGGPDFDRDGRDGRDPNNFRRNLSRGGSVDSNIKDFHHGPVGNRHRHDSFNRRNQENDNFEHFHSYNRKSHSRKQDTFLNNSRLPPRLQQAQQQKLAQMKLQQQQQQQQQQQHQQQYNNDCDNPKRFNNRNNQTSSSVGGIASNKGKYPAKEQSVGGGNGGGGSGGNNNENRRDNDI